MGKRSSYLMATPANVPEQIHQLLEDLTTASKTSTEKQKGKPPDCIVAYQFGSAALNFPILGNLSISHLD
jgi:hypothetical protein